MTGESVEDQVREILADTYACGRVWEAWSYGTMSQRDFSPAAEDDDIVSDLVALLTPQGDDSVLGEVAAERARQDEKWGEQNHLDGTGPLEQPIAAIDGLIEAGQAFAPAIRDAAKEVTDRRAQNCSVTWTDILLEEVFEALAEEDLVKLRTELIQTAAVAVQWVSAIDRRAARVVAETGAETTHACPPEGSNVMPCCLLTPFDVPRTDRMTAFPDLVTCKGDG
jgi:hypothetical protein